MAHAKPANWRAVSQLLETGADLFLDAAELLGDPAERVVVTEAQHSRKRAAINPEQDSTSLARQVVPDRDPHPARGRQPG